MKKLPHLIICLAFSLATSPIVASTAASALTQQDKNNVRYIRQLLQQIVDVNLRYHEYFHEYVSQESLKNQTPDATIVLCSDSRVDTNAINDRPAGSLFVIRNIGNQVETAFGSVEYGVNNLEAPLLLIVGHSGCGAVKAAMSDFSKASAHLKKELTTLHVNSKETLNENIIHNVNNQVKIAMSDFKQQIDTGDLVVVGMIYDLHDDFELGHGRLIVINVNGETDTPKLAINPYVKDLRNLKILKSG